MRRLRGRGVADVVEGAGPRVMGLASSEDEAAGVRDAIKYRMSESTQRWTVEILPVATEGARVEVFR